MTEENKVKLWTYSAEHAGYIDTTADGYGYVDKSDYDALKEQPTRIQELEAARARDAAMIARLRPPEFCWLVECQAADRITPLYLTNFDGARPLYTNDAFKAQRFNNKEIAERCAELAHEFGHDEWRVVEHAFDIPTADAFVANVRDRALYDSGVRGVAEYTYKGMPWLFMAAFDSVNAAKRYADECAYGKEIFQYRVRDLGAELRAKGGE